jgi:hypothetical protein
LPKSDTKRRFRRTLRNKCFFGASDTTAAETDNRARSSFPPRAPVSPRYDAAQERGEVQAHGGQGKRDVPKQNIPPTVNDIGLTRKQVHEARIIRDADLRGVL